MSLIAIRKVLAVLFLLLIGFAPGLARAGYVAVSLHQIEQATRSGRNDADVVQLGGLTRLLGMVVDPAGDLILIGRRDAGVPPLTRDHLAIALRAVYLASAYPLVSLDATADTSRTGRLAVRFEGGIEGTAFGNDLLQADIALKRIALGLLPARIWGVPSYLDLSAQATNSASVHTRFWFLPKDRSRLVQRDGVFVIRRLDIAVRTETIGSTESDPPADRFSEMLEAALSDVAAANPALARVKPLFDMAALAAAIKDAKPAEALDFWLHEYRPAAVETPTTYAMLRNQAAGAASGSIEVEGGIDLTVLAAGVADGDTSALRQATLASRPAPDALSWPVPIAAWPTDSGALSSQDADERAGSAALARHAGTSVLRRMSLAPTVGTVAAFPIGNGAPPVTPVHLPAYEPEPVRSAIPPSVGGVWLAGASRPTTGSVSLGSGGSGFSLLVDGADAVLPADRFARFVTALWAVYLSPTPPGISIDPLGAGSPKHAVRYIGNVVNSDLARAMRESDYLMKQLAVGSKRVELPGFESVDGLTGLHGLNYVGASRRFWFVSQGMEFRAADGVLRFEGGHLTLKTEYVLRGGKGTPAEPADVAFTDYFNGHFDAIAARFPVFGDLLEYAKLVGLATYLKQQAVPLLWFLLANRAQIVTEDSPGVVDAIVRRSKVFEGLRIEGGVDLAPTGRYLPDPQVLEALRAAAAQGTRTAQTSTLAPIAPSVRRDDVAVGQSHYAVLPQTSAASGRDSAGRRYQTDIALRRADGQPGLELVRYFDPAQRDHTLDFGDGWSLLTPYRVEPADGEYRTFRNVRLPARMSVIDRITGQREVLAFNADRLAIAGWLPEEPAVSRLIGLFPLSDGSFRLADKLGAEFAFDPAGNLTDMELSPAYRVHYETQARLDAAAFVDVPYQLEPEGPATREVGALRLPTRLRLRGPNGEEVLALQTDAGILGYYPTDPASRLRMLAILADGSLRLLGATDTEAAFDPERHFIALLLDRPVATGLSQGDQHIGFHFAVAPNGNPIVAEASSSADPGQVVQYHYDQPSRLVLAEQVRR